MDTTIQEKRDKQIRTLVVVSVIFFVCAVVFSVAYLVLGGKEKENKINIDTNSLATTTPTPAVRVESFTYTVDPIDITVEYPQLVHMASSTIELALNEKFKDEAKKIYDQNLKDLQDASSDFVGKTEVIPNSSMVISTTTGTSTDATTTVTTTAPKTRVVYDRSVMFYRKVAKDKIYIKPDTQTVSFAYELYIDTGGAHGTFSYDSETLDIATGKTLTLRDILQGDYEKVITKNIDKQIHNPTDTCVRCDALSSALDDVQVTVPQSFILSDLGITFLYSAYDLGAYALTSTGQEITVSKDVLVDNILRTW